MQEFLLSETAQTALSSVLVPFEGEVDFIHSSLFGRRAEFRLGPLGSATE
jgi:hypothetical protein